MGPNELKNDTVSMSLHSVDVFNILPSEPVEVKRVVPDDVEPIASTFFAIAGDPMVHTLRPSPMSPSLPAENMSRFSGCCIDAESAGRYML